MDIKSKIVYKRSYCVNDFKKDYNSYGGNAYGLANTLLQTAFLRPKIQSKKVKNLELNALNTIYKSMKWAETNNEPELAVKYANLYITNKKRLKK